MGKRKYQPEKPLCIRLVCSKKSRKTARLERKKWGEGWETRLCNGQEPVQVELPCFLFMNENLLLTVVFIQKTFFNAEITYNGLHFKKPLAAIGRKPKEEVRMEARRAGRRLGKE